MPSIGPVTLTSSTRRQAAGRYPDPLATLDRRVVDQAVDPAEALVQVAGQLCPRLGVGGVQPARRASGGRRSAAIGWMSVAITIAPPARSLRTSAAPCPWAAPVTTTTRSKERIGAHIMIIIIFRDLATSFGSASSRELGQPPQLIEVDQLHRARPCSTPVLELVRVDPPPAVPAHGSPHPPARSKRPAARRRQRAAARPRDRRAAPRPFRSRTSCWCRSLRSAPA